MESEILLNQLIKVTRVNIKAVKEFKKLPINTLRKKEFPNQWNIIECIEHLNCFGTYYIPQIIEQIEHTNHKKSNVFKTGILGNYFAKSMFYKEKLNSVKTHKSTNPLYWKTNVRSLDKFIFQQQQLIGILEKSKNVDLNKIKIPNSILKFIKLNLGDTFRVLVYHNQRHITQAQNVLKHFAQHKNDFESAETHHQYATHFL